MADSTSRNPALKLSENEKEVSVNKLKELISENEVSQNIPVDDEYLLRFLYSCDFNVQNAYGKMISFYELVRDYPDWFPTGSPTKIKSVIDQDINLAIPVEDKEGRPIFLIRLGRIDVNKVEYLDLVHLDHIWTEYIFSKNGKEVHENGLCVLIDAEDLDWGLLKWMTPYYLGTSLKIIEAFPVKNYEIHVVNPSVGLKIFVKIVWPFMSNNLKDMVKFHFKDLNSLHRYISPENLPLEYGGTRNINITQCREDLYRSGDIIKDNFDRHIASYVGKLKSV